MIDRDLVELQDKCFYCETVVEHWPELEKTALNGPTLICQDDQPQYVLISAEHFALICPDAFKTGEVDDEISELLRLLDTGLKEYLGDDE